MTYAIRSEWIKLRTARSNVVLICIAVAGPVLVSTLTALFNDFETSDGLDTFGATVLGPCFLCVFLAGVIGVLGIGQEYRHNTIRVTFVADPRRSRVLAAKVLVTTAFGAGIALVTQTLCYLEASLILTSKDINIGITDPGDNLAGFLGQIVLSGLFTLLGFGLCAIMRQPAGAIPVLLLWPLIGEGIIGGIFPRLGRWLPFRNGLRLPLTGDIGDDALSRVGAGIYFTGFVALVVAVGWFLVERRDA
jgi:ABC-2 type transport system permease protein